MEEDNDEETASDEEGAASSEGLAAATLCAAALARATYLTRDSASLLQSIAMHAMLQFRRMSNTARVARRW